MLSCIFRQCAFFVPILVCLEQPTSSQRYEKCKQRTHQREAAGRVFGTPVALETDFRGTSLEMLKGWPPRARGKIADRQRETQTETGGNILEAGWSPRVEDQRFSRPAHIFSNYYSI